MTWATDSVKSPRRRFSVLSPRARAPSGAPHRAQRALPALVTRLGQLLPQRPKPNLRLFLFTLLDFAIDVEGNSTTSGSIPSILYPRIVDIAFSQLSADESDKNRRNVSGMANSSSSRGLFLKHIFLLVAPSSLPTQAKWRCQVAARLHSCTSGVGPSVPIARSRVHERGWRVPD